MIRASDAYPTRLCPGRTLAQEGLPEIKTAIAEEGHEIHAALHDPAKAAALEADQIDIVEGIVRAREALLAQVFAGADIASLQVLKEEQVFVVYNGKQIISGHPDYVAIGMVGDEKIAFIPDYKSGWLDVPAPEINIQLRAYAVAIWQMYGVDKAYVTIIPRFGKAKLPAAYDRADLKLALEDLALIAYASEDVYARRIPSIDACRYCRARGTSRCPESMRQVAHAGRPVNLATLSGEDMAHRLDLFDLAEKIMERERQLYAEILEENPKAIPGYFLKDGVKKRVITDTLKAFNQIADYVTAEEFSAKCKIGIGDFEELIRPKLREKGIKGKKADEAIKELLTPVISWTQNNPSLSKSSLVLPSQPEQLEAA